MRVGDKVVYPHHGAATVIGIENKDIGGVPTRCLVLMTLDEDLMITVPEDKADSVGLRRPVSVSDIDDVRAVLDRRNVREPTNWSRRFKNHQEKLRSGDVFEMTEVVRNLSLRKQRQALSLAEDAMLKKARQALVSELACTISEDAAEQLLVEALGEDARGEDAPGER